MSDQDKLTLLYKSLEQYPAALSPDQVAEALGISRRTVDRLLGADGQAKMEYFVINEDMTRKDKRVTKAALIEYMLAQHVTAAAPRVNGESLNQ